MKKNIAILDCGDQSEYEVSQRSGAGIKSFLRAEKYNTFVVTITKEDWLMECVGEVYNIDRNDFNFTTKQGRKETFYCAYVTIHGFRKKMVGCKTILNLSKAILML